MFLNKFSARYQNKRCPKGVGIARRLSWCVQSVIIASASLLLPMATEVMGSSSHACRDSSNLCVVPKNSLLNTFEMRIDRGVQSADTIFKVDVLPSNNNFFSATSTTLSVTSTALFSFSETEIRPTATISTDHTTGHIYFSLKPEITGTVTITVTLSGRSTSSSTFSQISQQEITVAVRSSNSGGPNFYIPTTPVGSTLTVFAGSLYILHTTPVSSLTEARRIARNVGGRLAYPRTTEEHFFLIDRIDDLPTVSNGLAPPNGGQIKQKNIWLPLHRVGTGNVPNRDWYIVDRDEASSDDRSIFAGKFYVVRTADANSTNNPSPNIFVPWDNGAPTVPSNNNPSNCSIYASNAPDSTSTLPSSSFRFSSSNCSRNVSASLPFVIELPTSTANQTLGAKTLDIEVAENSSKTLQTIVMFDLNGNDSFRISFPSTDTLSDGVLSHTIIRQSTGVSALTLKYTAGNGFGRTTRRISLLDANDNESDAFLLRVNVTSINDTPTIVTDRVFINQPQKGQTITRRVATFDLGDLEVNDQVSESIITSFNDPSNVLTAQPTISSATKFPGNTSRGFIDLNFQARTGNSEGVATVQIRVTDNGNPTKSATATVFINVTNDQPRPLLDLIPNESRIQLWLDASDPNRGGTGWTNKSSNAVTINSTGTGQTTSTQNNKPTVLFNNNHYYITNLATSQREASSTTWLVVFKGNTTRSFGLMGLDNGAFDRFVMDCGDDASLANAVCSGVTVGNDFRKVFEDGRTTSGNSLSAVQGTENENYIRENTWRIGFFHWSVTATSRSYVYDPTIASTNRATFTENNNTNTGADAGADTLRIGRIGGINRANWRGEIAEVIVIRGQSLSQADRVVWGNALAAKWGLPVASDIDFYTQDNPANGNYDDSVLGIVSFNGSVKNRNENEFGHIIEVGSLRNQQAVFMGISTSVVEADLSQAEWRVSVSGNYAGATTLTMDIDHLGVSSTTLNANQYILISSDTASGDWQILSTAVSKNNNNQVVFAVSTLTNNQILRVHSNSNAPRVISGQSTRVSEAIAAGSSLFVVRAEDTDRGVPIIRSFAITAGNSNSLFSINSTGLLSLSAGRRLDSETATSHTLSIAVGDGANTTLTATTVVINVIDVNEFAPTIIAGQFSTPVSENVPAGSDLFVVQTNDTDTTDIITNFAIITGNSNSLFSINSTGLLSLSAGRGLDFETATSHTLSIQVGDSANTTLTATTVVINVTDFNEFAPNIVAGQSTNVIETTTGGTTILAIRTTDNDRTPIITNFTITVGNNNRLFTISNTGLLSITNGAQVDFERQTSHTLSIQVSDSTNTNLAATTVVVNVINVNEFAPVVVSSQSTSVLENLSSGSTLFSVNVNDADRPSGSTSVTTFTITAGNTDLFAIDTNTGILRLTGTLDFETTRTYSLLIQAGDGITSVPGIPNRSPTSSPTTVVINVIDVNDNTPTVIAGQSTTVLESLPIGSVLFTIGTTDTDATTLNQTISTYSITAGNTNNIFSLNTTNGLLSLAGNLDFETATSHTLSIQLDDGINGLSPATTVVVTVRDANDNAPTVIAGQSTSVLESISTGSVLFTIQTTDADITSVNQIVTGFVITAGNSSSLFTINSTGLLSLDAGRRLDFESATSHTLSIQVGDGVNSSLTATTVVINVDDVNEFAPTIIVGQFSTPVSENVPAGSDLFVVQTNDRDRTSIIRSFAITAGNSSSLFTINSTGLLSLDAGRRLDSESATSHTLSIAVGDGANTTLTATTVVINVIDVNEFAPTINAGQSTSVLESISAGSDLFVVQTNDTDTISTITNFAITAGNSNNLFIINSSGLLSLDTGRRLDAEGAIPHTLSIAVGDGVNTTATAVAVVVNVGDVNDNAPTIIAGQSTQVSESIPSGSALFTLQTTDVDITSINQIVTGFAIISGNSNGLFTINSTGLLSLATGRQLDFESATSHTLSIQVGDSVNTTASATTFTIQVIDVNLVTINTLLSSTKTANQIKPEDYREIGVNSASIVTANVSFYNAYLNELTRTNSPLSLEQIQAAINFINKKAPTINFKVSPSTDSTAISLYTIAANSSRAYLISEIAGPNTANATYRWRITSRSPTSTVNTILSTFINGISTLTTKVISFDTEGSGLSVADLPASVEITLDVSGIFAVDNTTYTVSQSKIIRFATTSDGDADGDGIPDSIDTNNAGLQTRTQTGRLFFVRALDVVNNQRISTDNISLSAGRFAQIANNSRTPPSILVNDQLGSADYPPTDSLQQFGTYNFRISRLNTLQTREDEGGQLRSAVKILLPLTQELPIAPIARKLTTNNTWQTYDNQFLESAFANTNGECDDLAEAEWRNGLTERHNCVRVTVLDGDGFDTDGRENGSIRSTIGFALSRIDTGTPSDSGSNSGNNEIFGPGGGGGCSLNPNATQNSPIDLTFILLLLISLIVLLMNRRSVIRPSHGKESRKVIR